MFLNSLGPILVVLGGCLAVILPGIGSAKAVGRAGQACCGVITEDPEKYGKLLILQALPGTQGIYGLITWFILMGTTGLMGGTSNIDFVHGLLYFISVLPIAFVGFSSALAQGRAAESAVALVARRPEQQSKGLIMAAMVETYAILALLVSILGIFLLKF